MSATRIRATTSTPCPICAGAKSCSWPAPGETGDHLCAGWESSDPPAGYYDPRKGGITAGKFRHFKPDDGRGQKGARLTMGRTRAAGTKPKSDRAARMIADHESYAARLRDDLDNPNMAFVARQLADTLRLPAELLAMIAAEASIGVTDHNLSGCVFTFPERVGDGNVTSIQARCDRKPRPEYWAKENQTNKNNYGTPRGLAYLRHWHDRPGPVFVVEGWSDVLAMACAGLACVGRYTARGGAELLAALILKHLPADRPIYLVGENDPKFNDDGTPRLNDDGTHDWPGKDGAVLVAGQLAALVPNPVFVVMVPDGHKDTRDYLTSADCGDTSWPDRGAAFLKHAEATAEPAEPAEPTEGGGSGGNLDLRTEILVTPNEHEVTAKAAAVLSRAEDVFRRDSVPVIVVPGDDGRHGVRPMPKTTIRDYLTRLAYLKQEKQTKEGVSTQHVHPPKWLIDNLSEQVVNSPIRPLNRIVSYPQFLADGSVLVEPGYHAATGTLLLPGSPFITLPESPTRIDAQRAAAELLDLVSDFPFCTDADRAGWVAAALTLFAHAAYTGPAPMFWITKNCPAVGGSKLVHAINNIADGRDAPITTYIHDATETRKLLTALAIENPPIVFPDNVSGQFGNAPLAAALTGTIHKDRILGVSATFQGSFRPVWLSTSNNGQLVNDLHRRVLPIRLETKLDHPEGRTDFKYPDLLGHIRTNRARLITACLTILRAWHVAGRPNHKLTPFDFREWSGVVREAVVFAGLPDPATHRLDTADNVDPERESMRSFIECWPHLDHTGRGVFASAIADRVRQARDTTAGREDWELALVESAETLAGRDISAKLLGMAFQKYKGQRFDGRYLAEMGKPGGKIKWGVRSEPAASVGPVGPVGPVLAPRESETDSSYTRYTRTHTPAYIGEPEGSNGSNRSNTVHSATTPTAPYNLPPRDPANPPPTLPEFGRMLLSAGLTWDAIREHADNAGLYLPPRMDHATPLDMHRAAFLLAESTAAVA